MADDRCAWCNYPNSANPLAHDPHCRLRTHPHSEFAKRERAKPLNALTRAALPVGLVSWDEEIAYLADALQAKDLSPKLRSYFQTKHDALARSRAWLASKIDNPEE